MAAAVSILIIMSGAALVWAFDGDVGGADATLVGVVAMIVGGLALLVSLIVESRREAVRQRETHPEEAARARDERYDTAPLQ
jgi:di/tricarboxylate transporter